jgi:hypothetical protein
MNADKASINFKCSRNLKGGDTDRGRVKRISCSQLSIIAQSEDRF